jgi:hypothetical protein
MPSKHDMRFAVPLCRRRRLIKDGQHGVHVTCYRPLLYCGWDNTWWCEDCQVHTDGETIAAEQRAVGALLVAA